MIQIGKTAQNAIAVMSYLVECQRDQSGFVNSMEAAQARGISKALAAKILTTFSQADLVKGSTGPGGGYQLVREPCTITLMDVVECFELQNKDMLCPFGEGWCGHYDPCPLHDQIFEMKEKLKTFLTDANFGGFAQSGYSSKRGDDFKPVK